MSMFEDDEYSTETILQNYIEKNQSEDIIEYINTKMTVQDIMQLRFRQHSKTSNHILIIL